MESVEQDNENKHVENKKQEVENITVEGTATDGVLLEDEEQKVSSTDNPEDALQKNDDYVSDYLFSHIEKDDFEERESPDFYGLNDPDLLDYIKNNVYSELDAQFGDDYIVDDIQAIYISNDYLEELAYNSQSNIYFGYSLKEIEQQFSGTKYVFTLGDDGSTVVKPFEDYDDTFEQVVKNVAIGTGVILICVTVSVVSGGLGAPAVSMIFATAAKSAAEVAVCTGVISGAMSAAITGYETKDWEKALKAGALSGSDSFKWGALTGAATGGALNALMLRISCGGGLTMDEVAVILQEHQLPARFIKQIHSMEEYKELLVIAEKSSITIEEMASICTVTKYPLEIVKCIKSTKESTIYCEQAQLMCVRVNDRLALIRNIDLSYKSELAGKTVTNLERMRQGYAAIDPLTGEAYELHHIGQTVDSPLAILTRAEHRIGENNSILHDINIADGEGVHSLLSDSEWAAQREDFWIGLAKIVEEVHI